MAQKSGVGFIETMDCLPVSKLPEGPEWTYELKLDGYRLEAVRSEKEVTLYSRRQKMLNGRFGFIAKALQHLPAGTVVDGEIVALGPNGHADFYLLQKFRSAETQIIYYVFDILVHENRDLTRLPLSERRRILGEVVKPNEHVALSAVSDRSAAEMLKFAETHGVEGLIAKRADSVYQPGKRTGLWMKYRINLGQEFVVGGYIPGHLGVDSVVVGFIAAKALSMRHASALVSFPGPDARCSRRSDAWKLRNALS